MKKLLVKVVIYATIVLLTVMGINYLVDPANIYRTSVVDNMVEALSQGKTIESPMDVDEGLFKKKMISELCYVPETVVIGSSHVMYIDWDRLYSKTLNAGMSGSYLGEYYAVVGLLKIKNIKPKRIIFGVDAWAFIQNAKNLRHTTLNKYALYAKDLVAGNNATNISDYNVVDLNHQNMKEMFSFSYFQSSFRNLISNGIEYYFKKDVENIVVCDNDEPIKETNKITPSMRYIMSLESYKSLEENEAEAFEQVLSKDIYQIKNPYPCVDDSNFQEFVDLVDYLICEGIEIEFYLPTYYPTMYELFETNNEFHGIIEVEERVRELGNEKGIIVHGTYNPKKAGIKDTDFADCLHMTPDKMFKTYELVLE